MIIIHLVFVLFFLFIAASVLYLFLLSFAGRFFYREGHEDRSMAAPQKRIAILVPAYKEDGIILSTASGLLTLDYPSDLYDVYIIADSFREETLEQLRRLPLHTVEVSFVKSTKAQSLNEAFDRMTASYDIALISDADNVLSNDFLLRINEAFLRGERVVQGRRVAKNLDSPFAILDACSESIGNHIFRKGSNALGLSASLIGSGMAFDPELIREVVRGIDSVVEDKVIQLRIAERRIFIKYLEGAVLFDEKVGSSDAFGNQRKRWVSGQHVFLVNTFSAGCRQLLKGNVNYFNLGVLHSAVPPRSFLFVLVPLLVVLGFLAGPVWGGLSVVVFLLFVFSLGMGIPRKLINKDLGRAMLQLPKAVMIMFGTLLHLNRGHKTFIHTVHTKTDVDSSLLGDGSGD